MYIKLYWINNKIKLNLILFLVLETLSTIGHELTSGKWFEKLKLYMKHIEKIESMRILFYTVCSFNINAS
jgi:hypothetical protein